MKKTTRDRTVSIRMTSVNHLAAERVAALEGRTVSSLIEFATQEYMRDKYPHAFMQPTYYTAHPDGVFREASPQPFAFAIELEKKE